MPYGAAAVLGSHFCVALSPATARVLHPTMLEAQSEKLPGQVRFGPAFGFFAH